MKINLCILSLLLWTCCNRSENTPSKVEINNNFSAGTTGKTKLAIIVLPPFDEINNAGISPRVQEYLETEILKDTALALIKFPYSQLMNVPYQNVFDKKYCKPIIDSTKSDIVLMTKLDLKVLTGKTETDKWNLRIRIYSPDANKQINSKVVGDSITAEEIQKLLSTRRHDLMAEIKNIH